MRNLIIILFLWCTCQAQTKVPNTTTFCFSDVVAAVGGTCLTDAFDNATDAHFDPTYKGSKNCLLNFRNYNNYYSSTEQCGDFQRDNCPDGYTGETGEVCVEAGYSISWISQNDADDLANQYLYSQGFGQSWANENFGCIPDGCPTGTPLTGRVFTQVNGVSIDCDNVCDNLIFGSPATQTTVYIDENTNKIYVVWDSENCVLLPDGCYALECGVDITLCPIQVVDGVITFIDCP